MPGPRCADLFRGVDHPMKTARKLSAAVVAVVLGAVGAATYFELLSPGGSADPVEAAGPAPWRFSRQRPVPPAQAVADCNGNGVDDLVDISSGTSLDCDGNDVPDECETFDPEPIKSVKMAGGFQLPVSLAHLPGDGGRLFVVEQTGKVRIFNLDTGQVLLTPFLDFSDRISTSGERGLLDIAFHPQYASNGFFYVNYSQSGSGDTIIARYSVSGDPNVADPDSEVILKMIPQDDTGHNGSQIRFGPDGYLYFAVGDGGTDFDANNRPQDPQSLLGKIIRLDVDNPPTYVPATNPFVGDPGVLDEIWAFGMRNPFRFTFDRLTGDMWIGDVGQAEREEIDFEPAGFPGGRNYGWSCMEGTLCAPWGTCTCNAPELTLPVHEIAHRTGDGTCSVIGGFVYRGCRIPHLGGRYFYADYCGDYIRSFRFTPDGEGGGTISDEIDHSAELNPGAAIQPIVTFGEDDEGELYFASMAGGLWKIVPASETFEVCGNLVVGPGEECEPPGVTDCDCACRIVPCPDASFADDFEADLGWSVSGGASSGAWVRAVPADHGLGDPPADADGSGMCFVTGVDDDVDGETRLTSPPMDMTDGAIVSFYYWLGTSPVNPMAPEVDYLRVEAATDPAGTDWTILRTYAFPASTWRRDTIEVGVELPATSTVRIRFVANDRFADDILEAGVDQFQVCPGLGFADCNANCIDDAIEVAKGLSPDCNANGLPDECDITAGTSVDCAGGPVGRIDEGAVLFNYCDLCHGPDGASGEGFVAPNIRNKTRDELWSFLLPPTTHPGGSFTNFTQEQFADLEAFLADGGSRGRPDLVPDECQGPPDCDDDGTPDACELEAGTQVDLDYDGIPDGCEQECIADITGFHPGTPDGVVDALDLLWLLAQWGSPCTGPCDADFTGPTPGVPDGNVDALEVLALIAFWGACP
jgi:hypothetical protein